MASFRCYDSSDVIAILIVTNFPLYLIQLWWQFFPNACLWRRSLCSNLAGIDSEKLYRATFICQYGLFCCMALVSFRLFCKNLANFWANGLPLPLAKNCPYAYALASLIASLVNSKSKKGDLRASFWRNSAACLPHSTAAYASENL